MRIILTLTCCVGLALFAGAAQHDDQDNNQGKKKGGGGNAQPQVVAAPQTSKKFKAGPGGGPSMNTHVGTNASAQTGTNASAGATTNAAFKKTKHGQVTGQGNLSSNANNTSFNKTKNLTVNKTVNKNITVNKNFKVQKFNLSNNPNPKYQAVKFNQNYKIAGANKWKGSKYQVFVNYQPQWHDQDWWKDHHNHITIVFGAPYYWDAGYWYPCWGYSPSAAYYFDGPIYASSPEYDPGQVVANVQAALQEQGYYHGEVDGILGGQTRAALADYQVAQGLEPTGAVDLPTLESLGMA